ncbi:MAG: hypothetical protein Q8O38_08740 [Sulfurimicrobium sp.]|nr:hypothetical protein [Sulfurimicrobium sp.]
MLEALESVPGSTAPLLWTDYVELRALIHPDRCFSRGDLSGLERRMRDTRGQGFAAESRWRDLINFAGVRRHEFGDSYPFAVSDDEDTLELRNDGTPKQTTYLHLLLAALMRHIPGNRRTDLARNFEETCFAIFTKLMPDGAEIRATWANAGNNALYQGTLYQKMCQVAADLRCTANFKERDFIRSDSGDGGIDLISWHPMADERKGMPISFAQCGCSKSDWRFKQLEASPAKHYHHLPVMHPWACYYFLPLDLRHPDGDWAHENDIGQAIIVDRLRLVRLATQYALHESLPALPLLSEVSVLNYA